MKTNTKVFRGSVENLKAGDRFQIGTHFWIVGEIMKPFDSFTVRITVTPETEYMGVVNGEYVQRTFGKEVVL